MATISNPAGQPLVLLEQARGHAVIPLGTPLIRLHYFDGKFLRAADLQAEQRHLRGLSALSNQAGGAGVVRGFDCSLSGDTLHVGPGMAIDPNGRILLLTESTSVSIPELIERSRRAASPEKQAGQATGGSESAEFATCEVAESTPTGELQPGGQLYLITLSHIEAYCGEEEVYGKICERACVTSTDRPFVLEGIVIRAEPWPLPAPLPDAAGVELSEEHLRSRIAAVYFADEEARHPSRIGDASTDGLQSASWCRGSRSLQERGDVPVALLARNGPATRFLDPWIPRRERLETPARQYWDRQLAMRPWSVFLAQLLQFQCQLRDALASGAAAQLQPPGASDALLDSLRKANESLTKTIRSLAGTDDAGGAEESESERPAPSSGQKEPALAELEALRRDLRSAARAMLTAPAEGFLVRWGIVETPSAGLLPVSPQANASINTQVESLLGGGVALSFRSVRAGEIPHALEEARHLDRISLIHGLDHPDEKPAVEVLIPDGVAGGNPAADDSPQYFGTRNWVLFRRPRSGAAIHGRQDLTRIVATSWNHGSAEKQLLTVSSPRGGELGRGIVIGFERPVTVLDETGKVGHANVLDVQIRAELAGSQPSPDNGVDFTLVELLGVLQPLLQCGLCLRGTLLPVTYETSANAPERIVKATATGKFPAAGLAFVLDPEDPVARLARGVKDLTVRLRCDFIEDLGRRAVDGEFVRGKFPTGDGHPGGLFESWFRLAESEPPPPPPPVETVCNEVFVATVVEGRLDEFLRAIESSGLAKVVSAQDSRGKVEFILPDDKLHEPSMKELQEKWAEEFPPNAQQPSLVVAVSPPGSTAQDHERHRQQSEVIRERLKIDGRTRHTISSDNSPFPSDCMAATVAVLVRIG